MSGCPPSTCITYADDGVELRRRHLLGPLNGSQDLLLVLGTEGRDMGLQGGGWQDNPSPARANPHARRQLRLAHTKP